MPRREEYETAVMVEELFLRNLGYNRKHYYISSARNGISIHWQGNWFENGCEYCILEV